MSRRHQDSVDLADRIVGAVVAVVFAVPTVAICWYVLNFEVAFIHLYFSTAYFWVSAGSAVVIGFLFPDTLQELLSAIWRFIFSLAKWH